MIDKPKIADYTKYFVYDKGEVICSAFGENDYIRKISSLLSDVEMAEFNLFTAESINEHVSNTGWLHQSIVDEDAYDFAMKTYQKTLNSINEKYAKLIEGDAQIDRDIKIKLIQYVASKFDETDVENEFKQLVKIFKGGTKTTNSTAKNADEKYHAFRIEWVEYEAGWGQRHCHYTYHLTHDEAVAAIKEYNKQEAKRNPGGRVPTCYIAPSVPQVVEIPKEIYFLLKMDDNK